ncbi:MAG: molybdopterin-binding protein [Methylococcales bacterium]|nr:molybdopterin-binding protein [Methylococcales bacterium]
MKPVAEIFSQGEELVCGQIVDSNAAWLSRQLVEMGFRISRHTAVGDNLADLTNLFREIAQRCDCCICTGGLGPTVDDLTAEAVSLASGLALQPDAEAMRQIEQYFTRLDRPMPDANRKQAYLPAGAQRIDNPLGTAPGFALRFQRCRFVFLPGVPMEMRAMFDAPVRADLQRRFTLRADTLITLRSIGVGESAIQQALADWPLPAAVQLGFRVTADEVQTKLLFPAGFPEAERRDCVERVAALIGNYVFAIDDPQRQPGDLVAVIAEAMRHRRLDLAVMETASHGLIAAKCLDQPWLLSVDIRMDKSWQTGMAADSAQDIARALAAQLADDKASSLALVQLYHPLASDADDRQDAIVLYNALYTPQGVFGSRHCVAGAQTRKQNQAALLALDLLRRYLQDKCP